MESSVLKALNLLQVMIHANEPLGVTALARMTDQHKSNVHRMLQILCAAGLAFRVGDSGTYRPSLKLWELGSKLIRNFDIIEVSHPILEELSKVVKETVHLSVMEGMDVVYIDRIESSYPIMVRTDIGSRAPAQCVATGKVLLSGLPVLPEEAIINQLEKHADFSVLDIDTLKNQLETVARQGWARTHSEWRQGVIGYAAPIYQSNAQFIAAIGVSGPEERMSLIPEATFAHWVKSAADLVSAKINGQAEHRSLADILAETPEPAQTA